VRREASVFLLLASLFSPSQDSREALSFNGAERTYRLFVPDGFAKNGPGPAVVLFNGSGSPVDSLWTFWKELAQREGVVLIGPTAFASGAWRIPQDSPDFSHEVVEAVKAKYPIDPRRVYLAGHSGGAGHVVLLGLLESEYFAAVAAHATALHDEQLKLLDVPKRMIPINIWIGTRDDLVPLKPARDTVAKLSAKGFFAKLWEINGHTHNYAERGKELTNDAWAFLKEQQLSADPKFYKYSF
jgi:poly(3-hydroxybutyrate) depolymerase